MAALNKKSLCGIVLATILICFGLLSVFSGNFVFGWILRTQMVLSNHSANYLMWQDLPKPIKTSMYLVSFKAFKEHLTNTAKMTLFAYEGTTYLFGNLLRAFCQLAI
jgi:hypothetical protein